MYGWTFLRSTLVEHYPDPFLFMSPQNHIAMDGAHLAGSFSHWDTP